jgi:hypothetical protein
MLNIKLEENLSWEKLLVAFKGFTGVLLTLNFWQLQHHNSNNHRTERKVPPPGSRSYWWGIGLFPLPLPHSFCFTTIINLRDPSNIWMYPTFHGALDSSVISCPHRLSSFYCSQHGRLSQISLNPQTFQAVFRNHVQWWARSLEAQSLLCFPHPLFLTAVIFMGTAISINISNGAIFFGTIQISDTSRK